MFGKYLERIDFLRDQILKYSVFINDELIKYLENYYHIRLTYTSNYIEGYTYTEEETSNLIFNGQVAAFKSPLETGAVRAHDKCFEYMVSLQRCSYVKEPDILRFHELLAGGLENKAIPGRYRDRLVRVGEQLFLPPQLVNQAVKDMFRLLESAQEKLPPVLFGIRFHKDLIFIHPFMDGNGRVARLAMNTVLLQHKYLPIDISPDKIMEYHKSITATYEDSTAFYKFMLQQAIQSYEFLLQKLKLRDLK